MVNNSDCGKTQRFMMKYMDNTITDPETEALLEHISLCAACAEDYALYECILATFAETPLIEAPTGFEDAVMAKITMLPCSYTADENRVDTFMCVVLGSFSALSGVGMLIFINKDWLLSYAISHPRIAYYVDVLTPVSNNFSAAVAQLARLLESYMELAGAYASSMQFILVGIFSVLALAQFFVYKKSKVKI